MDEEVLKYFTIESLQELVHQALAPMLEPFTWQYSRLGDSVAFTIYKADKIIGGINIMPHSVIRDYLRMEHWVNSKAELVETGEMENIWITVWNYFYARFYQFVFSDEFLRYLDFQAATSSAAETMPIELPAETMPIELPAENEDKARSKTVILEWLKRGKSLTEICNYAGLTISYNTIRNYRDELIEEKRLSSDFKKSRGKLGQDSI